MKKFMRFVVLFMMVLAVAAAITPAQAAQKTKDPAVIMTIGVDIPSSKLHGTGNADTNVMIFYDERTGQQLAIIEVPGKANDPEGKYRKAASATFEALTGRLPLYREQADGTTYCTRSGPLDCKCLGAPSECWLTPVTP